MQRELRFIQFLYTVRKNPNSVKSRCISSRSLEYAECVAIVNNGKEMNKELERTWNAYIYTAIVLVAVAVRVCLIKLLKTE